MEISFNLTAVVVAAAVMGLFCAAGAVVVLRIRRAGLALHREIAEVFAQVLVIKDEILASRAENSRQIARLDQGLAGLRADALPVPVILSRIADTTSQILDAAYETETGIYRIANQVSALASAQHQASDLAALAAVEVPPKQKRLRKLDGAAGSPQFSNPAQAIEQGGATRIMLPKGRWAYAVVIPLTIPAGLVGVAWVRVRAAVLDGHAGFGLLNCAGDDYQDRVFLEADPNTHAIFLRVKDVADVRGVVIQNSRPDGKGGEILLEGVSVYVDDGVEKAPLG